MGTEPAVRRALDVPLPGPADQHPQPVRLLRQRALPGAQVHPRPEAQGHPAAVLASRLHSARGPKPNGADSPAGVRLGVCFFCSAIWGLILQGCVFLAHLPPASPPAGVLPHLLRGACTPGPGVEAAVLGERNVRVSPGLLASWPEFRLAVRETGLCPTGLSRL